MNTKPALLLIGPLPIEGDVIGGTKVSFASMVEDVRATERYVVQVHNLSRPRAGRGRLGRLWVDLCGLLSVLACLLSPASRFDAVVFNTSSGGALLSGPFVWACCALRRWPLAVRLFGGDLDLFIDRAAPPLAWLARRTTLAADLVLLQTHALCERFGSSERVRWWPTTRELHAAPSRSGAAATRFLFLSQLRPEKGAQLAIEAALQLPPEASLTLYGPEMPGFDVRAAIADTNCLYGGALSREEVPGVLAVNDVLVFPSTHSGEGVPGILIEALQTGLPVICSRWRALPEIVDDGVNGLLVDASDSHDLAQAMQRLASDPALFETLRAGALLSGERYRATEWNETLCAWLDELCDTCTDESRALSPATFQEAA